MPQFSGRCPRLALATAVLLSMVPAAASAAQLAGSRRLEAPASRLGRPEGEPPFVCAHLALGGALEHGNGDAGYGVSVVFHPATAADFLDFLYDWNTGLVLQADRLGLGDGGRVLSADLLLRRYLAERGAGGTSILPFLGAGPGASSAWPGADGDAPGLKYWSLVLEVGQERRYARGHLLVVKGQVRILRQEGIDWTTWSVQAGLGLPFPW